MLKLKIGAVAVILLIVAVQRHFQPAEPDRELAIQAAHEAIGAFMERIGGSAEFPTEPASLFLSSARNQLPPGADIRGTFIPRGHIEQNPPPSRYHCCFSWDGKQRKYGLLLMTIDDITRVGDLTNTRPVAYFPR
jgi:hypothetical protein